MKKMISEMKKNYDELYSAVALREMEENGKFGTISDKGMKPPVEVKITKIGRAKLNKVWNNSIKK